MLAFQDHKKPIDNFSGALNKALIERYGKVPSAAIFMNQFNFRAYGTKTINRETARKWLKGLALPKASAIQILVDWLNINPADIFAMITPSQEAAFESSTTDLDKVISWHKKRKVNAEAMDALASVSPRVAVLDMQGDIVLVNQAWRNLAFANSSDGGKHLCEGINYLTVCDQITGFDKIYSHAIAKGIRQIIADESAQYSLKYPCYTPKEKRWHTVQVTSYGKASSRYVIVSHETYGELED